VATLLPQYQKKQRQDGGFDFFNGNQKINVDQYVQGTGVNKAQLVQSMANQGDRFSQNYIQANPVIQQPSLSMPSLSMPKLQTTQPPQAPPQNDFLTQQYKNGGLGGFLAGAVGFVKDAATQVVNDAKDAGEGIGKVAIGQGNANALNNLTQVRNQANAEHTQRLSQLVDMNNPNDPRWNSPEVQNENNLYNAAISKLNSSAAPLQQAIKESSQVDPARTAAAAADTFLNVGTLGAGTAAKTVAEQGIKELVNQVIKQGAGSITKEAVKNAAVNTGKAIAQSSLEGGLYGAGTGAINSAANGSDLQTTIQNILQGAAVNGLFAGGLRTAGDVVIPGTKFAANKVSDATPSVLNAVKTAVNDQRGSINLGSIGDSINNFATKNHPAVVELNNHLNLLRQADEQMATNGLAPNNAARINNAKAQALTLQEIQNTQRKLSQGGYIKVPGGSKDPRVQQIQKYEQANGVGSNPTKAAGFKAAALQRALEGKPTPTELRNTLTYLNSNYIGKEVPQGTVVGTSFGKVRVKTPKGDVISVEPGNINAKKATNSDAINHLRKINNVAIDEKVNLINSVASSPESLANNKQSLPTGSPHEQLPQSRTEGASNMPTSSDNVLQIRKSDYPANTGKAGQSEQLQANRTSLENSALRQEENRTGTFQSDQQRNSSDLRSLPNDTPIKDASQYVKNMVEKQKASTKTPIRDSLQGLSDEMKHLFVDDAVAHERYIKDKAQQASLREGVDRVRNSDMIARQFAEDNGMKTIGKMNKSNINEFQQYLIAKRAQELEAKGIKTGRNSEMDKALISQVGNKYKTQEQTVRDYSRKMLDYSFEHGLISKELRDRLVKENPDYVPMNRIMDNLEQKGLHKSKQLGNLSKQSVVQKMQGSDRTVDNPIESLLRNTSRMVNEGERNKVARAVAESEPFKENILKEGEKARPGFDTVHFLVDGKKITHEVPQLVAEELKNLNGVLPGWANKTLAVVGAPTRILRTGATTANPIFAVSNVVRDQLQTLITGNIKANIKGTPKALMAAFDPSPAGRKLREELQRNGIMGSEYRQTYGYKSGELMKELQNSSNLSSQAFERLKHPIDALADVIGRTEVFTRAQQYFGTEGDNVAKAQAARNNTLNFSRSGSITRVLNKIVPFINAGVQGGRITVQQFKDRPVRTTVAFGAIAGVALAAKAINQSQNQELYDRLSDEEKKNNLIIFGPDAHYDGDQNRVVGVTKIPMPQMVYPVLDAVNNLKGKSEDFARIAGDVFTALSGVDATNPVNQLTPTVVKPFLEAGLNKSTYSGQDIVSQYDQNKKPEDKGAKYTTGVARGVASATGIDAPVIDNFIQNWGGGLFKDLSTSLSDNPDNSKDGGGVAGMLDKGFSRRFLSGSVKSQYDIQQGLSEGYKNQIKQSDAYKSLSVDDQAKLLDKVDADTKAIAGIAAKTEQGKGGEIKKDLTDRQKSIIENGFSVDKYLSDVQSAANKGVKISDGVSAATKSTLDKYNSLDGDGRTKWFNDQKDAEYQYNLAKYENDKKAGTISSIQDIKRKQDLKKDQVGSSYDKTIRDLYGYSKSQIYEYLTTPESGVDKQKMADQLKQYDQALKDNGLSTSLKFKTGFAPSKKGGGKKGSSVKSELVKLPGIKTGKPDLASSKSPVSAPVLKKTQLKTGKIAQPKITKARVAARA